MTDNQRVRFHPGSVVLTLGAAQALQQNNSTGLEYIHRHVRGDWGELCKEDREANEAALTTGARLLSAYTLPDGTKMWIITEAAAEDGARLVTTLLLPEEY